MNIPSIEELLSELDKVRCERDEALLIHQLDTGTEFAVAELQEQVEKLTAERNAYKKALDSAEDQITGLKETRNRLSELCDKWNLECDELREDNKRLAAELYELETNSGQWEQEFASLEIATLKSVLREAKSVLFAWAANHESAVTQEAIATINKVLGEA